MRTFRQWLRGDDVIPVLTDPKKDLSLSEAVQKHAKENHEQESRVVKIYRMGRGRERQLQLNVDVKWVYENRATIETALRDLVGGGKFEIQFCNDRGRETWRFDYDIAGQNRGQKDEWDGGDGKPKPQKTDDRYMALVDKLVDGNLGQRLSPDEQLKNQVELVKVIKGGGDGEFLKEMALTGYNNMITQKEMGMENAMRMLELARTLQPSVEKEDPLTALVTSLSPILGQILAARAGGRAPQFSSAELQEAQGQLQQLEQHTPQLGQTVPTPGPGEPDEAAPVAQGAVPSTAPASGLDAMLDEFRRDVAGDAEPAHLAYDLWAMVERAQVMSARGRPHPMFAGLINQTDPMRLSNEYDRFTAAIPELKRKPETAAAIKAELEAALLAKYTGAAQPEPELQQVPAEPAGDTVGRDDVPIDVDTAGPTPGSDQPGADDGTDADQPDGPPVSGQASEDDNAPAHV